MPPLPNKEAVGPQTLRSDKEEKAGEGDSSGYTEGKNNGDEEQQRGEDHLWCHPSQIRKQ